MNINILFAAIICYVISVNLHIPRSYIIIQNSLVHYLDDTVTRCATDAASDTTGWPIWPARHHAIHGRGGGWIERFARYLILVYAPVKGLVKSSSYLNKGQEFHDDISVLRSCSCSWNFLAYDATRVAALVRG